MTQSVRPEASEQSARPISLGGLGQDGRTVGLLLLKWWSENAEPTATWDRWAASEDKERPF